MQTDLTFYFLSKLETAFDELQNGTTIFKMKVKARYQKLSLTLDLRQIVSHHDYRKKKK